MSAPKLEDITSARLEEYVFPGTDAAAVFVSDSKKIAPELSAVLSRSSHQHWHPVEGGHRVKIPYAYVAGAEAMFEKEDRGWNAEDCDYCSSSIPVGERCWTIASDGGLFIVCQECRKKVPEKKWWHIFR